MDGATKRHPKSRESQKKLVIYKTLPCGSDLFSESRRSRVDRGLMSQNIVALREIIDIVKPAAKK